MEPLEESMDKNTLSNISVCASTVHCDERPPIRYGIDKVHEPTKLLLENEPKPALKLGGHSNSLTDTDNV